MATATKPAVAREILEDRWACATTVRELDDEWSKLMWSLDKTLIKLQEAVTRREWTGTVATDAEPAGRDTDGSGAIERYGGAR